MKFGALTTDELRFTNWAHRYRGCSARLRRQLKTEQRNEGYWLCAWPANSGGAVSAISGLLAAEGCPVPGALLLMQRLSGIHEFTPTATQPQVIAQAEPQNSREDTAFDRAQQLIEELDAIYEDEHFDADRRVDLNLQLLRALDIASLLDAGFNRPASLVNLGLALNRADYAIQASTACFREAIAILDESRFSDLADANLSKANALSGWASAIQDTKGGLVDAIDLRHQAIELLRRRAALDSAPGSLLRLARELNRLSMTYRCDPQLSADQIKYQRKALEIVNRPDLAGTFEVDLMRAQGVFDLGLIYANFSSPLRTILGCFKQANDLLQQDHLAGSAEAEMLRAQVLYERALILQRRKYSSDKCVLLFRQVIDVLEKRTLGSEAAAHLLRGNARTSLAGHLLVLSGRRGDSVKSFSSSLRAATKQLSLAASDVEGHSFETSAAQHLFWSRWHFYAAQDRLSWNAPAEAIDHCLSCTNHAEQLSRLGSEEGVAIRCHIAIEASAAQRKLELPTQAFEELSACADLLGEWHPAPESRWQWTTPLAHLARACGPLASPSDDKSMSLLDRLWPLGQRFRTYIDEAHPVDRPGLIDHFLVFNRHLLRVCLDQFPDRLPRVLSIYHDYGLRQRLLGGGAGTCDSAASDDASAINHDTWTLTDALRPDEGVLLVLHLPELTRIHFNASTEGLPDTDVGDGADQVVAEHKTYDTVYLVVARGDERIHVHEVEQLSPTLTTIRKLHDDVRAGRHPQPLPAEHEADLKSGLWDVIADDIKGLSTLHVIPHGDGHHVPYALGCPDGIELIHHASLVFYQLHRQQQNSLAHRLPSPSAEHPAAFHRAGGQQLNMQEYGFVASVAAAARQVWGAACHMPDAPDALTPPTTESAWLFCGHGEVQTDRGRGFCLRLADGTRLGPTEIVALERVPPVVVLSSCNLGLQAEQGVLPEVDGLVSLLMARGCRLCLAHLVPVEWEPLWVFTGLVMHHWAAQGCLIEGEALARRALQAKTLTDQQAEALRPSAMAMLDTLPDGVRKRTGAHIDDSIQDYLLTQFIDTDDMCVLLQWTRVYGVRHVDSDLD